MRIAGNAIRINENISMHKLEIPQLFRHFTLAWILSIIYAYCVPADICMAHHRVSRAVSAANIVAVQDKGIRFF
jgi:hypothetical protein